MIKYRKVEKPIEFDSWTVRDSVYKDLGGDIASLGNSETIAIPLQTIKNKKIHLESFIQGIRSHVKRHHKKTCGAVKKNGTVYLYLKG